MRPIEPDEKGSDVVINSHFVALIDRLGRTVVSLINTNNGPLPGPWEVTTTGEYSSLCTVPSHFYNLRVLQSIVCQKHLGGRSYSLINTNNGPLSGPSEVTTTGEYSSLCTVPSHFYNLRVLQSIVCQKHLGGRSYSLINTNNGPLPGPWEVTTTGEYSSLCTVPSHFYNLRVLQSIVCQKHLGGRSSL
ncbi:hypothetical protein J6590_001056 [Homalodisca vitripennis]|nr:hypothetical protein J6590_001056 [Homalodisca vitripennis]